jgi:hypothetical protein
MAVEMSYMDFVEHWLGISPDGGSGAFEAMVLVLLGTVLVLFMRVRRARRRSPR